MQERKISFYKEISRFYDQIFPFSENKRSFLRSLISEKSHSLLDLGCATGEQVFFAESMGLSVAGLDNDENLLDIALEKKKKIDSEAVFINSDMRKIGEIFEGESFDMITCMGNTLVHLGSYDELCRLFDSIYSQLIKGGIFAAQIVNYGNPLMKGETAFKEIEGDDFIFIRGNRVVERGKKIEFSGELILKDTGEKFRNKVFLYPVNSSTVRRGLEGAGFSSIRFYGDFDAKAYEESSNALILIAEK